MIPVMATYNRSFDAAREAQGFRSQAHLDSWFAYFDHTENCATCAALDGHVMLDDGNQPTAGRCAAAVALNAKISPEGK